MNKDVLTLEQLAMVLLHNDQDAFLSRVSDLTKRASELISLLYPKKAFVRLLLKSTSEMVSKNLKMYLRDVLDDDMRLIDKLNSLTHAIEAHQTTYLAKISLSVNRHSEEENQLMFVN